MGLYNYWQDKLPKPLDSNLCCICDEPITAVNKNPEMDAFQFKCKNCNPKLIIEISGSLLASNLYDKLREEGNKPVRNTIHKRIKQSTDKNFSLTTTFISQLIR